MQNNELHEIQELVVNFIDKSVGYRPVDGDFTKPLNTFGLTSVQGMLLIGEIEDTYSLDLPHDLLLGKDSLLAYCQRIYELVRG